MGPSLGFVTNVFYSAQNGSESRFRVKCFFFRVDLCYILWSVLLHHLNCISPLLDINCTIRCVLRQCFSILFEFSVIRKGCIFPPFCHLSFYFFAPAAIVHSFSNYIVALRDDR